MGKEMFTASRHDGVLSKHPPDHGVLLSRHVIVEPPDVTGVLPSRHDGVLPSADMFMGREMSGE